MRVCAVLPSQYGEAIESLLDRLREQRSEMERESLEGQVVQAIAELKDQVVGGRLRVSSIVVEISKGREDRDRVSGHKIGKVIACSAYR